MESRISSCVTDVERLNKVVINISDFTLESLLVYNQKDFTKGKPKIAPYNKIKIKNYIKSLLLIKLSYSKIANFKNYAKITIILLTRTA